MDRGPWTDGRGREHLSVQRQTCFGCVGRTVESYAASRSVYVYATPEIARIGPRVWSVPDDYSLAAPCSARPILLRRSVPRRHLALVGLAAHDAQCASMMIPV